LNKGDAENSGINVGLIRRRERMNIVLYNPCSRLGLKGFFSIIGGREIMYRK
jgi:hypothetical protein